MKVRKTCDIDAGTKPPCSKVNKNWNGELKINKQLKPWNEIKKTCNMDGLRKLSTNSTYN